MNIPSSATYALITLLGLIHTSAFSKTFELGPQVLLEQSTDGTLYASRRDRSATPAQLIGPLSTADFYAGKVRISGRRRVKATYVVRQEVFVQDHAGQLWTIDTSAAYIKARLYLRNVAALAVPFGLSLLVDRYELIQDPYFAQLFYPRTLLGSYVVMSLLAMMAPPPTLVGAIPSFDGFNFFHQRVATSVRDVIAKPNGDYDVVSEDARSPVRRLSSFIKYPRHETCQDWLKWWW